MQMTATGTPPATLARALAELGRIVKTTHVLDCVNDGEKRRRLLVQLNWQLGVSRGTVHKAKAGMNDST